jgi:hypothetical protein
MASIDQKGVLRYYGLRETQPRHTIDLAAPDTAVYFQYKCLKRSGAKPAQLAKQMENVGYAGCIGEFRIVTGKQDFIFRENKNAKTKEPKIADWQRQISEFTKKIQVKVR